tara:strand:+ start:376 stop:1233 length:858 start_codon:yes stop_codon:yes gene_type:complete
MSASLPLPNGIRAVPVRRNNGEINNDYVVIEEPLEIHLNGKSVVVTMRTPGHDEELAAGFLYSEQLITSRHISTIQSVAGTNTPDTTIKVVRFSGDRVEVTTETPSSTETTEPADRAFRATAACGVCSKESLKQLDTLTDRLPAISPVTTETDLLESLPDSLRSAQELFEITGGIHAAGIFSMQGKLLCLREDIGRHNAVDKVIGHYVLQNAAPLHDRILVVSGRAGFELVQKALNAAIPVMVSVGAASSVAVEMATTAGMTLYTFAGRGSGNLHVPSTHGTTEA